MIRYEQADLEDPTYLLVIPEVVSKRSIACNLAILVC
jgi:hypothetical protein